MGNYSAMTNFIRVKVASCTSTTPDKQVCLVSSESDWNSSVY